MAYYFKPSAVRDLKKLAKPIQKRIIQKLDFYMNSGNFLRFAKPLHGKETGEYRVRIGEYRVICDIGSNKNDIIILVIGHRKNIYK